MQHVHHSHRAVIVQPTRAHTCRLLALGCRIKGNILDPCTTLARQVQLSAAGPEYWLFSGALKDVVELSSEFETAGLSDDWRRMTCEMGIIHSPTIWWPHDRSWLLHSEIDYDSTIVGGTPALIHGLVADPGIEALRVDGDMSMYANGDRINCAYPSGWPQND